MFDFQIFFAKTNCDETDPLNSSTGSLETESVWENIYILIPEKRISVVDLLKIENVDPLGDCSKCKVKFILLWAASPLVEKLCRLQQEIHCKVSLLHRILFLSSSQLKPFLSSKVIPILPFSSLIIPKCNHNWQRISADLQMFSGVKLYFLPPLEL